MGRLKVFIDNREKHRVSEAIEFFDGFKDYETSVAELKTGDYVCGNCCVEYKTTGDFVSSVRNRRIFKQALRMSESYANHYVFIETEHAAIKEAIKSSYWRTGRKFTWNNYYGALASLSLITTPIIVKNFSESLKFMEFLFRKSNDGKIRSIVAPDKKYDNFLVNCLASIDDIGGNTALLIIDSLDLRTYNELCKVTYDDLISIKGIGSKTANIIMSAIGDE